MDAPLIIGTALVSAGAIWGACFAPIAGKISDAIGSRRNILIFCMVCAVLFGLGVFTVHSLTLYIVVIILNGFVGGGISSMLWAACTEVVPSHLVPGATATLACTQSVGMFLGSMFVGNVVASIGFTGTSIALAVIFFAGLLIAVFGLRSGCFTWRLNLNISIACAFASKHPSCAKRQTVYANRSVRNLRNPGISKPTVPQSDSFIVFG